MEACIIDPYDLPTLLTPRLKLGSHQNYNNKALYPKKNFILCRDRSYQQRFSESNPRLCIYLFIYLFILGLFNDAVIIDRNILMDQ
jgi:hypothetical protein